MSPLLERLARRFAGRMKLIKVDVENHLELAARYDARSIPLLVLFSRGAEIDRRVGALREAELTAWLEPHLTAAKPDLARGNG